jgi:UDP-3-O-[3-hydroxymyristoyl] glucosamine N-acyltransferase
MLLTRIRVKPEGILEADHLIMDGIEASNEGTIEDGVTIAGRVKIGRGTVIFGKSVARGPSIIG